METLIIAGMVMYVLLIAACSAWLILSIGKDLE
jgi:hypothetical protein